MTATRSKVKSAVQLVQGGTGVTFEHLRGKVAQIEDLGTGERKTRPLVAKYADIWHYFDTPETLAHKNAILDRHAAANNRDCASIQRSQEWVNEDIADTYARAGVTLFTLVLWAPHDVDELKTALRWRDRWNTQLEHQAA